MKYEPRAKLGALGTASTLLSVCLLPAATALAQSTAEPDSAIELERIVVTARRTVENVQTVPQTVNVLSADELTRKGVDQASNINGLVSNLVWVDGGGGNFTNSISLRGIYSNANSQGFDPSIAVYIDDVYVGNQFGFNGALLDVDHIEVLKGPQGTLFGRNSPAGAISIQTIQPSTDKFSATADVKLGNYDSKETRALLNIPLSGIAAIKFSGIYSKREGFQFNVFDDKHDINDLNYYGGKLQLLLRPSDELDFLATADYFKGNDHQDVRICVQAAGKFPCPNPTVASLWNDVGADNDTTTRREAYDFSLKANWRPTDALAFTSITAYRNLRVAEDQDQDYSAFNYVRSGTFVPKDWQFSQELRLATNQQQPLRGVFGLYYYKENRETNIPLEFTPDILNPAFDAGVTSSVVQSTNSDISTESRAVFAQGQYDILSNLTFEAGARYTHDDKGFTYGQTVTPNAPGFLFPILGLANVAPTSGQATYNKPTYTTSLSWHPLDALLGYVRYSTGFKAGGFVASTYSDLYKPTVPFGPENSDQVEVGLKTQWFNNRVRLNIAGFTTNYRNTQVQLTDPITLDKTVGNFGSARSNGFELEGSAALARGLTWDANYGYQHSRFITGMFVGQPFQYVPTTTANTSLSYERPAFAGWLASAATSVSYQSAMNLNTSPPASPNYFRSGGATTLNARIGLGQEDRGLSVYLYGNNLTDSRRVVFFMPASVVADPVYQLSAPRTFGLELKETY